MSCMDNANEKIGHLIAQIRQERSLTQAEFARRLGTSQSAVNRMEHGHQNLSLETLGRISDVLNKQLISSAVAAPTCASKAATSCTARLPSRPARTPPSPCSAPHCSTTASPASNRSRVSKKFTASSKCSKASASRSNGCLATIGNPPPRKAEAR